MEILDVRAGSRRVLVGEEVTVLSRTGRMPAQAGEP